MPRSPFLLGTHDERERATRVGIARMVVGGSVLLTTGLARRAFGLPAEEDTASTRMLARLFGIRNVVLGTWALMARDQGADERRLCYRVNAAVDAADLVVIAWAAVTGEDLARMAVMSGALGTSALLAWLDLLGDVG